MTLDKPQAFLVFSIVVALVAFVYFLSTFVPRHSDDVILNKKESDVSSITAPTTNATDFTASSYPMSSAPTTNNRNNDIIDDRAEQSSSLGSGQTNQSLDNLTEDEIWILIEDLEKQSEELLQESEEKSRLAFKLQGENEVLFQAYEIESELVKSNHDAIEAEFEREVLGGRSVHDVVTSASDGELEEFRAHPLSDVLVEACLQYHEVVDTFTAQSHANVDRMNALWAEGSELYLKSVGIKKDIADLKAMLP